MFKYRVSNKDCGPKQSEVTREWTRLHNENLHDLYSSPVISGAIKSRIIRWVVHVELTVKNEWCVQGLVRKPYGKRPTWKI
jgi:hypothetical protein